MSDEFQQASDVDSGQNGASCYFCSERERIERHHIVPRRYDGSDDPENIVSVCPTCHSKLERLYDKRFYNEIGANNDDDEDDDKPMHCDIGECIGDAEVKLEGYHNDRWVCSGHTECYQHECTRKASRVVEGHERIGAVCEEHARCRYGSCKSLKTEIVNPTMTRNYVVQCFAHADPDYRDPPTTPSQ